MSKELCFCIENRNLYLEKVLVDYMDVPIFFLCKDERQYYVALCTEVKDYNYVVVQVSSAEVYDLLHGNIPMRDMIRYQKEYWEVLSGEEILLDTVKKHQIAELDIAQLPEEGAYFQILTEEMKTFVQEYDNDFFDEKYFEETGDKILLDEGSAPDAFQPLNAEVFFSLGDYSFEIQIKESIVSTVDVGDMDMLDTGKKAVKYHESDGLGEWKGELAISEAA